MTITPDKNTIETWKVELSGLIFDMVNKRPNKITNGMPPIYRDIVVYVQKLMDSEYEVGYKDGVSKNE